MSARSSAVRASTRGLGSARGSAAGSWPDATLIAAPDRPGKTKGGEPPALRALPGGWFGLRRPSRDGAGHRSADRGPPGASDGSPASSRAARRTPVCGGDAVVPRSRPARSGYVWYVFISASPVVSSVVWWVVVSLMVMRRSGSCADGHGGACGHDGPLHEELPAPDAPRLAPLERPCEALLECRAGPAQRLRELDVRRALGEPELGVVLTAGTPRRRPAVGAQVDQLGQAERGHLSSGVTSLSSPATVAPSGPRHLVSWRRWSSRCGARPWWWWVRRAVLIMSALCCFWCCGWFVRGAVVAAGQTKGRGSRMSGSAAWRETGGCCSDGWSPERNGDIDGVVGRRDGERRGDRPTGAWTSEPARSRRWAQSSPGPG